MLVVLTNIPTPYRSAFFNALQNECAKAGIDFHVLYCARSEPRRNWEESSLKLLHSHEFLWGFHPHLRSLYPHINPNIVKRIWRFKPKYLLIAGAWNTPTMLMALACRSRKSTQCIFWSEGHEDAKLYSHGWIPWLRRLVYSSFDEFAVPNSKSAEWAIAQCKVRPPIIFLPNSIDCDWYRRRNPEDRVSARNELDLAPSVRILLQVAGLEARKGSLELAQSFLEIAPEERLATTLVFVGGGPLESGLRKIAAGSDGAVLVAGSLQPNQVRQWLWAADVFLLNTFRDPNPLAPIEAGTAGLPIAISSHAGNSNELVKEIGRGWVIGDPKSPIDVLRAILRTPLSELTRMGQYNSERFVDRFSARKVAADFIRNLQNST